MAKHDFVLSNTVRYVDTDEPVHGIAGEAIEAGQIVYRKDDDRFYPAAKDVPVVGLALHDVEAGGAIDVYVSGNLDLIQVKRPTYRPLGLCPEFEDN